LEKDLFLNKGSSGTGYNGKRIPKPGKNDTDTIIV
jgi:hypothetical protein